MRKGEIRLINLDPAIGSEIRKVRPAVIVSDDAIGILPLKVIVPITEWNNRYAIAPWLIKLEPDSANGLEKLSAGDAFQVRSVSTDRFVKQIGSLSEETLQKIINALAQVLGIRNRSRIDDF